MKEKTGKQNDPEDLFKPSAPVSTGTIPRHRNFHADFGANAYQHESDSTPSAPPLELMDQVTGYESVSFDAVNIPPPPGTQVGATVTDKKNSLFDVNGPHVTEKQARDALLAYARKRCCYGSGVAKNMAVTLLHYSSAFHYTLQTFTEKRETSWTFIPFTSGEIDSAENGPAPLPWSIEVTASMPFEDEVKVVPVPHTSSVKPCHRCHTSGSIQCSECNSKGWVRCMSCNGSSYNTDSTGNKERCFYCYTTTHGRGRQDCCKCDASGKLTCPTCDGSGHIVCYIQLTVSWKVNTAEHIVECSSIPEALVRGASGEIAYQTEGLAITPVTHFPDETINLASVQLLGQHKKMFKDQRILAQRQRVRIIPVTTVHYEWNNRRQEFYIYGFENKIYAPNYPQSCCCGCTLI